MLDCSRKPFEIFWALQFLRHTHIIYWMVVSNVFCSHPYLRKISNLTNIFQMGWNHQSVYIYIDPIDSYIQLNFSISREDLTGSNLFLLVWFFSHRCFFCFDWETTPPKTNMTMEKATIWVNVSPIKTADVSNDMLVFRGCNIIP